MLITITTRCGQSLTKNCNELGLESRVKFKDKLTGSTIAGPNGELVVVENVKFTEGEHKYFNLEYTSVNEYGGHGRCSMKIPALNIKDAEEKLRSIDNTVFDIQHIN